MRIIDVDYIPQHATLALILTLLPDRGGKVFTATQPQYFPEAANFASAAGHAAQEDLEHVALSEQLLGKGFA
ncbi:hypothetical protein D3C84_577520 [compost metagenome]